MSCIHNIRTDLASTFPPGGVWSYIGYNAASSSGPFTSIAAEPLVPVSNGTVLTGWGDNFQVDAGGITPGFYRFTYGALNLTVWVVDGTVCAGQNSTVTFAAGDATEYDLTDYLPGGLCLSPTSGGVWTDLDASGEDPLAFVPSSAGAGTYDFRYSLVPVGFAVISCAECLSLEAIVTVEVVSTLGIGIISTETSCEYEIEALHPSTFVENSFDLAVANDSQIAQLSFLRRVTWCAGDEDVSRTIDSSKFGLLISTVTPLQTGGWLTELTLQTTAPTNITVPLAPETAILSGVGGTVNVNDLYYNQLAPLNFLAAIKVVITNYLGTLGHVQGTHYDLIGVTQIGHAVRINFGVKNNPSTLWLGVKRSFSEISFKVDKDTAEATQNSVWTPQIPVYNINEVWTNAPCPAGANSLRRQIVNFSLTAAVNLTTYDFNNVDLTATTVTPTVSGTKTHTCIGKLLTTNLVGCGGSPTYLWSTGQTTANISVIHAGVYSVEVTCGFETASTQITVT